MQDLTLSYYIQQLHRSFTLFCGEELRKKGMSVGLMYFILYVCVHPGCTPAELTRDLALDRGYVLRSIQKLVEDGLFQRLPHPGDKRASLLYPTEKGQEIFTLSHQLLHRWDAAVLDAITPAERKQLFALLQKLQPKESEKQV